MAEKFQAAGAKVVMGGPHATLLPAEVSEHCDIIVIGEAEATWLQLLEDFYQGKYQTEYRSDAIPELTNLPLPR